MKRVGATRPRVTAKIRRNKVQAYGTVRDWYATVAEVRRRDGNRCRDCNSTRGPFHTHHVIPVSRGGRTVAFNLKTICEACHSKKAFHNHMR